MMRPESKHLKYFGSTAAHGLRRAMYMAVGILAGSVFNVTAADTTAMAITCDVASLQSAALADTTIVSAENLDKPVPHCKVEAYVTTTNPGPNQVNFRLQLPAKDDWNGRFYFIGVGGSGGYLPTQSQTVRGNPIVGGYAVAGTDKGHQGPVLDWSFTKDPAKALDNAHRGAHVSTVAAQQLTRAYYEAETMYRYHTGCSGGGDMGIKAIQKYPEDYDGVLLGWPGGHHPDPAKDGTALNFRMMVREMTREPGAWISPAKRAFAEKKVIEACDLTDGAKDEMIWDHRLCEFDFNTLVCEGKEDGPDCLTQPEATSFNNLVRHTSSPISNISMWSYLGNVPPPWDPSPTTDMNKTSMAYVILNGWARRYLNQPDRDVIEDPLTLEEAKQILAEQAAAGDTVPGGVADISDFEEAGGKSIFFVGEGDPCCSNLAQEQYFVDLYENMGKEKVDNAARLYQVPGWGHCGGGTGPTDGEDRMFQALVDWVEKGKPPGGIEMHRGYDRADMLFAEPGDMEIGVRVPEAIGRSRDFLVCPFPLVSVFDKSKADVEGAVYEAENWSCQPSR